MTLAETAGQIIELAEGLTMNASEAATQTFAPISAKGGGKSYLAGKFVEGLYDAGAPFAVLDPIGNWNAVTLGKDGKSPGLSVVVIGGERGDVLLDEEQAEAVGAHLVTHGVSAIIDLSELSKTRRKAYVAAFCEALYRAARKRRSPFMVVFEEAQLFAPQMAARGEERMLGAVTDIVRLGRNYGLGSMLVTQRPQSVSKEVLNQVECLFVGQLRGPQERKAIAGWVTEQGVDAVIDMKALPALEPGEFFCWSPSWLRVFRKVKILPKRTFDGSSTPVLGKVSSGPTKRSTAGIESAVAALSALSMTSAEKAEALDEDASELHAADGQIALLRGQLSEVTHENGVLWARVRKLEELLGKVRVTLGELGLAIQADDEGLGFDMPAGPPPVGLRQTKHQTVAVGREALSGSITEGHGMPSKANGLEKADRAILGVLAWQKGPISKARLALLAGYSAKGGGFGNALGRLRSSGRVEGSGELVITAEGRKAAPDGKRPPTGAALFAWWLEHPKVDTPMAAMLRALHEAGGPLPKDELQRRAGYRPNTGGVNNALSRLRTLGLVEGTGKAPIGLAVDLRK